MKRTLFILSVAALAFVGCNKENGKDQVKPLDATREFKDATLELVYGEPVTVEATAVTEATIEKVVLKAVKKSGETYEAVGEDQAYEPKGLEIAVLGEGAEQLINLFVPLSGVFVQAPECQGVGHGTPVIPLAVGLLEKGQCLGNLSLLLTTMSWNSF